MGATGPAGPDKVLTTTSVTANPPTTIPPNQGGSSTATCPAGTVVTGGGMRIGMNAPPGASLSSALIDTGIGQEMDGRLNTLRQILFLPKSVPRQSVLH